MQMSDDPDIHESEHDLTISDINDVWEAIMDHAPRRAWLVLNDNPEAGPEDNCWRPDLCVSNYIKIPFQKLREIAEPHDWGKRFRCSAIFRPGQGQGLCRSDGS